jgi:hypothetical protein
MWTLGIMANKIRNLKSAEIFEKEHETLVPETALTKFNVQVKSKLLLLLIV